MSLASEERAHAANPAREEAAALMWDVLLEAIGGLDGGGSTRRSIEAWTRATDDRWPLSFQNVCESLGLEADVLRSTLLVPDPA
jgi:hypothetical protein